MSTNLQRHARERRALFILAATLLIVIRFGLGLSYSLATPAWESDNEPAHFDYAIHLVEYGTPPSPDTSDTQNHEETQPPLYYLGLAAFLKITNSPIHNFQYPEKNPYFYYGTSGKNYALHFLNLSAEERQTETSLRFARFVTILFSLLGVAFGIRIGHAAFPGRPRIAFIFAALFALWPQAIYFSSVVNNDALAIVFGALITWQILSFRRGKTQLRLVIACLLTIALGTTFKLTVVTLIVPFLLMVTLTASVRLILVIWVMASLSIAGVLLLLRTQPGILVPIFVTFDNQHTFFGIIKERLDDPYMAKFIADGLTYVTNSFFALFGWGNVPLPDWINLIWKATEVVAGLGLVIYTLRWLGHWQERPIQRMHALTMLAAIVTSLVATVGLSVAYLSTHIVTGRYLLPVLPAFLVLSLAGWLTLRLRRLLPVGVLALFCLSVITPPGILAPIYAIPPEVQIADIPHKENVDLAPAVRFLGWDIPEQTLYPGEDMEFYLYWQAAEPIRTRYFFKIELIARDGQGYGILETIPGNGNYLATDWAPRRTFRDHYKVRIRSDFPAPSTAWLRVTVLPAANPGLYAQFGEFAVHSRAELPLTIPADKAARFRDKLLLRATDLRFLDDVRIQLNLTWQALDTLQPGTVFVHVLCGLTCAGNPISQQDNPPRDGTYPFQWWLPNEAVIDSYIIRLPPEMKPGQYPIRIGVYDTVTPEHLRWTVDYFGKEDGLLVAWLFVDENNKRTLGYTYPR